MGAVNTRPNRKKSETMDKKRNSKRCNADG